MTWSEVSDWVLFREKYGPLNLLHRLDMGFARVTCAHVGGKIEDHMPYYKSNKTSKAGFKNMLDDFDKLKPVIKSPKIKQEERQIKIAQPKDSVLKLEERKARLEKMLGKNNG